MAIKISPETNTKIQTKAAEDARSGKHDPPKGDVLVDTVFAPIDWLTGTPSTVDVAREQRKIYENVYNETKKS
ncbi:MAG: hypothetical protein D0528_02440 [Methylococcales bacterium]|nr:MAG: hypothetical protein D0528_02440 [Methylococcales bacterium]